MSSAPRRHRGRRAGVVALLVLALMATLSPTARADLAHSDTFTHWTPRAVQGAEVTLIADTDMPQAGDYSLRWSNETPRTARVYGDLTQTITVTPSTTYHFSAWVRGTDIKPRGVQVVMNNLTGWPDRYDFPTGSYDWQQVEWSYTTADDQTSMPLRLINQDVQTVWLDSLTMTAEGSEVNLIRNGGFEDNVHHDNPATITPTDERAYLLYDQGEVPSFTVASDQPAVAWALLDHQRVPLRTGTLDTSGGTATVDLGSLVPGLYYLRTTVTENGHPTETTAAFAMLAELPQRAWTDDSYFGVGGHFSRPAWDHELLGLMHQVGIRHLRDEISWSSVETTQGEYTIPEVAQQYMARADAEGINVVFAATYRNKFYDDNRTPSTPEGHAGYAAYASAVMQFFDHLSELNVYNEFNGSSKFNDGLCGKTPECYLPLLKATAERARADNPGITIAAPTTSAMSLDWIRTLLELGGRDYLDVISTHPYRYPGPPESLEAEIKQLNQITADHNDGVPLPVWFTELGWPTDNAGIAETLQADYLIRAQAMSFGNGVDRIYWYDLLNDGRNLDLKQDNFGLVRQSSAFVPVFTPKPALIAEAAMIRAIAGLAPGERDDLTDQIFSYPFGSGAETTRVLWSTDDSSVTVTAAGDFTVTNRYGTPQTFTSNGSPVVLDLSGHPIFVTGDVTVAVADTPALSLSVPATVAVNDPVPVTVTADRSADQTDPDLPDTVSITIAGEQYELSTTAGEASSITVEIPASSDLGDREVVAVVDGLARLTAVTTVAPGTSLRAVPVVTSTDPVAGSLAWEVTNNSARTIDYPVINWTVNGVTGQTDPVGSVAAGRTVRIPIPLSGVTAWQAVDYSASITPPGDTPQTTSGTTGLNPVTARTLTLEAMDLIRDGKIVYADREHGGAADLSGTIRFHHTTDRLWVHAVITDDVHDPNPDGPTTLWNGDAIQLAVSEGLPGEDLAATELGFGLVNGETQFHRWLTDEDGAAGPVPGAEGTITRTGTTTEYHVSIPWTSMGFEKAPELFSASILVADADGTHAREGYITWADGIASSKSSSFFRPMSMIGIPAPSCTETLTGTVVDRIAVTEGVLCLSDADLHGGIAVSDQASLIITDSTVTGRVVVDGGSQVRLIGSTFDGPVEVKGSTGHFVISGSTFTGRLSCSGNTHEPSDDGEANTVSTATGQCALLG